MDAQKFTQKSLEAIQEAQNIAIENQNAQIEEEHLMLALVNQEDSLIKELLKKMNISQEFEDELNNKIANLPKMTGGARQANSIYVSQEVDAVLANSEKIAKRMKDEYISVEHIMIAIMDNANSYLKNLFKKYGLNKNEFLKVLSSVRGNTRVTSDKPKKTNDEKRK